MTSISYEQRLQSRHEANSFAEAVVYKNHDFRPPVKTPDFSQSPNDFPNERINDIIL